jgi:hypothetical protein
MEIEEERRLAERGAVVELDTEGADMGDDGMSL